MLDDIGILTDEIRCERRLKLMEKDVGPLFGSLGVFGLRLDLDQF